MSEIRKAECCGTCGNWKRDEREETEGTCALFSSTETLKGIKIVRGIVEAVDVCDDYRWPVNEEIKG